MGRLIVTMGNRSVRAFVLTGIFLTAVMFIFSVMVHRYENRAAAEAEAEYRIALAGRLSEAGFSDSEAAELVTAAASPESIKAGGRILSGYGYSSGSPVGGEYAMSEHIFSDILAAAGVLICLVIGTVWFCRAFGDVRKLTEQLEYGEDISFPEDRDLTLLAEAAAALKKQTSHLIERIQEEKEYLADYLNDFSHQIKTPCTGLLLNNDILSSAPMDFEEQLDYFRRDRKCLDRISLLVGASLKLARLDAGAVEYNISMVDISEPVSEAVLQLAGIASENEAELVNEVAPGISLDCDRLWFCEAVTNLIKNAAEHTHGGQVRIYAE